MSGGRAPNAHPAVVVPRARPTTDGITDEEMVDIDGMSVSDMKVRIRLLDQDIAQLKNAERRVAQEVRNVKVEADAIAKRVKDNKRLPYLVATISEILELEPDNEDEELVTSSPANIALQGRRKKGAVDKPAEKSAVIRATNRHLVFLPVIGLVNPDELKPDDLVGVNKDTYLVYEKLPEEYDRRVSVMEVEEKPKDKYSDIGGLEKQITELMEAVVLPITQKDKYLKIGITPPKGVLLYGSPGTGKTMLARACAAATDACFLRLAGPQLVQMFIGDGARIVRDAFALAKKRAPTIIFIDELDAVGFRRSDQGGKHGSREVQRTMLELLAQLDGFGTSDDIKVIAATNRIDVLDPALLRSGRLDRKVEFPMPDEDARMRILEIHSRRMTLHADVNFNELARCTDDMNGAQLKAVCVEAGMMALRGDRLYVAHEDFVEGVAAVQAKKKASLNYFA